MKIINHKLLSAGAVLYSLLLLAACENKLEQPLEFNLTTAASEHIRQNDTAYLAKAGTSFEFQFSGNADFISFTYERFEETDAELTFAAEAAWGSHIENTLNVFISTTFPGLDLNNAEADAKAIQEHQWTNITPLCNLPASGNTQQEASISLNDYRGRNLVVAFRYKTEHREDYQPYWIIKNLQIQNIISGSGAAASKTTAAAMRFSPFDMLNIPAAYLDKSDPGVWNTADTDNMQIARTPRNRDLNEDWLISRPVYISKGITEKYYNPADNTKAISIKNMTNPAGSYTYTFDKAGIYTLTFYASNHNYKHSSSTTKTIKVIISE